MGYQKRDLEVVDYQLYPLLSPVSKRVFVTRGPRPLTLEPDQYFACIGPASTFGCYCEKPYGTLLQERLGLPTLNLGFAGAGPDYFLRNQKDLLGYINHARFAIVLVMSGRSESNSLFESIFGTGMYRRISDGQQIAASNAYEELLKDGDLDLIKKIVSETRGNWVLHFKALLSLIQKPKVLLWLSKRRPAYVEKYTNAQKLFGSFPQLVNAEMIEVIKPYCDAYVECVTERGIPQPLINRFTGKPTTVSEGSIFGGKVISHNTYYASPEMHEDAAKMLVPICQGFLSRDL
ncbi:hypothetical protein DO97_04790 [Neosynechococcus sphagnicola sy1]|uniref:DUF6473 domain-containing protein n=1 Tax=Neosynechococcus sphagnicola sy1 TaxID=1497020 RepID=A0A098TLP9_9CYAN|nr:hypothetical protein DO97_04790 [Neosynechococcus sphagnicola sy1]